MARSIEAVRGYLASRDMKTRQRFIGASLAFDPAPVHRYTTFMTSDAAALAADWTVVGRDLETAIRTVNTEIGTGPAGTKDGGRRFRKAG